jgi:phosphate uptake regulator
MSEITEFERILKINIINPKNDYRNLITGERVRSKATIIPLSTKLLIESNILIAKQLERIADKLADIAKNSSLGGRD